MTEQQGFVSIYQILEEIFDTFDSEDVPFATLVRWMDRGLQLIGAENYLYEDNIEISIKNRKGTMPCGIIYINASKTASGYPLRYASNTFISELHDPNSYDVAKVNQSEYTYSINGFNIFTDFDENVVMNVRLIPTDDDGYPMIPKDPKFIEAVKYYVMSKIAEKLWIQEKISTQKFDHFQAEASWYIGAAQSRAKFPSHDQLESISNMFTRIIEQPLSHSNFYKGITGSEILRNHPEE